MISSAKTYCVALAMVSLLGCNSSGDGAASKPSASAQAKTTAATTAAAAPTAQAAKMPELVEMKNDKRHFTFKVPKETKADPGGDSYSWDTMQIMVEVTMAPVAKNEDLMQVILASLKDGATIETKNEGDVLISTWRQPNGPFQIVCGQTGKSVAVRASFEPDHKEIALAMCKSLRIEK